MNFKIDLTQNQQNLLTQIDYPVLDKEYSKEEIRNCVNHIFDYCMSFSRKNNDLSNEMQKYNELIQLLVKNEK